MSNLAQIEAAVDALPTEEKQELLLFISARLREQRGSVPEPRDISAEQIADWIARDEADMRRFREGK